MTWMSRIKLLAGLILVLAIVAACTVIFNQRQTQVASTSATIAAERFDVGTDYGGLVAETFVAPGDTVVEGERLMTIESLQLERDLELGLVSVSRSSIQSDGRYVVRASVDGVVSELLSPSGSYVAPGDVVAAVDRDGSLFAQADFVLTPRDFGRIEDSARVELTLPDRRTLAGTVTDITVDTVDGDAHVTARIDSTQLVAGDANNLVKPGTPLEATLRLRDDGPLAGVDDAVADFAAKIGL